MKQLSIETINTQFVEFWGNMIEAGLDKFYNPDELKKLLIAAPAAKNDDSGMAYPGALLIHMNLTVGLAKRLAKNISGTFSISNESICKVCILQNLPKIAMFTPNTNEWEIKNRGWNYQFNELDGRMSSGSRGLFYAVKNGVQFDAFEWEAMQSIDKEDEDRSKKFYDHPLTMIVRHANEQAALVARGRYKNEQK